MEYVEAEIVRPKKRTPRASSLRGCGDCSYAGMGRIRSLSGCGGCPYAGMGQLVAGGNNIYTLPSGGQVMQSFPMPASLQDQIVIWIMENPVMAIALAGFAGVMVSKKM